MTDTMTRVLLQLIEVLERLDVPYLVGGSIASMIHGVVRTTLDADIVADLRDDQVKEFSAALADKFYLDAAAIHDAIQSRRCFNIIHLETMFKIDIFIPRWDRYLREEFRRRERLTLSHAPEQIVSVSSREDTILAKLVWYRLGGHVSDRQWRDVLEMLKLHRGQLDLPYLMEWSASLEVHDLLLKAQEEVDVMS